MTWYDEVPPQVVDTPRLVVDEARTRTNIDRVATATRAAGKDLLPHAKTHRSRMVAQWQRDAGARGLLVASLGEAEALAPAERTLVVLAYPVVGSVKAAHLDELARTHQVRVTVDSAAVVEELRAHLSADVEVEVLIEIETGLERVGVLPQEVAPLARLVQSVPTLRLVGVLTHEGHVGRRGRDRAERRRLVEQAAGVMGQAAAALRGSGVPEPVVSMGSTASWRDLLDMEEVTEVRPGLYVYGDMNAVRAGAMELGQVAASVLCTVVAVHVGRREFVLDGGSKTLGAEIAVVGERATFGYVPALDAYLVRMSEEHGIVAAGERLPRVGDRVAVVPNHICPVVNLHDSFTLLGRDGSAAGCPVDARGRSS
ncbi:D-serine deaminase-like pyridoxal phosphate-dependent protein [Nocardioides zeae]|uniref:D-serine deaminase-like pyridoxal phosphate-dependent protein n=1 Tax=Nocardioides zeae TaxID=1457234 RepID=A0ACC6IE21_9ACTN|nr:alanine racemase [Nocardioides zeae]MDR6174208.1 D-serine deaminase-like pyridoxal phosphate-dependent protein [Nocardioides zeae]MDR6209015.1 D-serine deaminase-like pyridoxal phosphate-dependent protein [Nocardioides zeae]